MIELRITAVTAAELMADLRTLLEPDPQGDQIQYVVSLANDYAEEPAPEEAAKPKRKRRTNAEIAAAEQAEQPKPLAEAMADTLTEAEALYEAALPVVEDVVEPVGAEFAETVPADPSFSDVPVEDVRARFAEIVAADYDRAEAILDGLGVESFGQAVSAGLTGKLAEAMAGR